VADSRHDTELLLYYILAVELTRLTCSRGFHLTSGIGGHTLPRYPNTLLPESLSSVELPNLPWILYVVYLSTINIPPTQYTRPYSYPSCSCAWAIFPSALYMKMYDIAGHLNKNLNSNQTLQVKNPIWNSKINFLNQHSNPQISIQMLKSPASLLQTHKTLEIQCQVKRHSSRIQSGKTAFSAELVKRYSVESRQLRTVISGALPSPNPTGVYRHTVIIIRIVSSAHARKDQLTNSARLQLPTHPRELYSTTC